MPVRDWKFRVSDILAALEDSLEITEGIDYESFQKDSKTLKVVLYNLAIIGEASRRIPKEIKDRYPAIPWREMGDMRNIVIHEYFGIDTRIIWETIKTELPPLVNKLKDILSGT